MDDKEYNTSDYFDENKGQYPYKANLYPYESRFSAKYVQPNSYYDSFSYTNESFVDYKNEQFTLENDLNYIPPYYFNYKDTYQPNYYSIPDTKFSCERNFNNCENKFNNCENKFNNCERNFNNCDTQSSYYNLKEDNYNSNSYISYDYFNEKIKNQKRRRSAKRKNRENTKCAHCNTTETPLWRHLDVSDVCNACWLYYKAHGTQRPYDPNKKSIIRRMRSKKK